MLYLIAGAVAAIIYSLRRIFLLEAKIERLDEKIEKMIEKIVRKKR